MGVRVSRIIALTMLIGSIRDCRIVACPFATAPRRCREPSGNLEAAGRSQHRAHNVITWRFASMTLLATDMQHPVRRNPTLIARLPPSGGGFRPEAMDFHRA